MTPSNDPGQWKVATGDLVGEHRVSISDDTQLELGGSMHRAWVWIGLGVLMMLICLVSVALGSFVGYFFCAALVAGPLGLLGLLSGIGLVTLSQRYDATTRTLFMRQLIFFKYTYGPGTYTHVLVEILPAGSDPERIKVVLKSAKAPEEDEMVDECPTRKASAPNLLQAAGQIGKILDLPLHRKGAITQWVVEMGEAFDCIAELFARRGPAERGSLEVQPAAAPGDAGVCRVD